LFEGVAQDQRLDFARGNGKADKVVWAGHSACRLAHEWGDVNAAWRQFGKLQVRLAASSRIGSAPSFPEECSQRGQRISLRSATSASATVTKFQSDTLTE
jgi:hypothetical protein